MININPKEHFEKQLLPYFNIKEYWDKGFKGQGITVCSMEGYTTDSHGLNVKETVLTYAPECNFISYTEETGICSMADHDEYVAFPDFADWCINHNVDIITSSLDWSCDKEVEQEAIKKLYAHGIIFCNCAGNSGKEIKLTDAIRKTYNIDKEVVTVSGIMFDINKRISWGGYNYGEAVDICGIGNNCPTYSSDRTTIYNWSGTSVATPFVAGLLAIYKSYDKSLNSKTVWDLIDLQTTICEYKGFKHKVLILPKIETLKLKEEVMEENKNNVPSEWAKESIQNMMNLGITDGTRPKDNITREEVICLIDRMYKLLVG